ncbi:MAG: phage Gp19/Gp15/Gp42 family protein [Bacteroidales bacterium]|nr:phage Gp19/Gp15/Gp42 family protein [Bacteroidales bacterium]
MAYATIADVEAGFRTLDADEQAVATALINEAAIIINSVACKAAADAKKVVTCRMVRRAISAAAEGLPMGATQGSVAAGGYSQSWTNAAGGAGELYLSKQDKKLLHAGDKIGMSNPYGGCIA